MPRDIVVYVTVKVKLRVDDSEKEVDTVIVDNLDYEFKSTVEGVKLLDTEIVDYVFL